MSAGRVRAASGWQATTGSPRVVLDTASVVVWAFDELRLVAASPAGFERLGYSGGEPGDYRLRRLVHPFDRERVESALAAGRVGAHSAWNAREALGAVRLVDRRGEAHWAEAEIILLGPEASPLLLCHAPNGASPRFDLEGEVLLDRLATLGTLAAGVVHEINDPLAYVMLSLEHLQRAVHRSVDDAARAELLARIEDAQHGAMRIATLVRQVRSFARREPGDARLVDVAATVNSAVRLTEHQIRRRARLDVQVKSTGCVLACAVQLEHVFINLLVNAAHSFVPHGPRGLVSVTVDRRGDDRVAVEVSDTGQGIPEQDLERIFEPFFTTKASGSGNGLGLAFCRRVIRALRGTIRVSSAVGRGTTFCVEMPLAAETDGVVAPAS